jgi:hypothetical protein
MRSRRKTTGDRFVASNAAGSVSKSRPSKLDPQVAFGLCEGHPMMKPDLQDRWHQMLMDGYAVVGCAVLLTYLVWLSIFWALAARHARSSAASFVQKTSPSEDGSGLPRH